jgi:hypothetical protein
VSSVRINQRLDSPYNPDGAPGTISTGAPGAPGRAPLPEEIYAAITDYIAAHPITQPTISSSMSESNRFGSGATGQPGSYVDIGTHGTLQGYVTAGGTGQTVNLYLQAKNGTVVLDGPAEVSSTLSLRGAATLHDNVINLREPGSAYWIGYSPISGATISGDAGGIGTPTNYLSWNPTNFAFSGTLSVNSTLTAASAVVTGTVAVGTPVVSTDTAITGVATEVKAVTVRKTAANRRGFVVSELPSDLVINGQVDVLGVLATLWAQVKALTP